MLIKSEIKNIRTSSRKLRLVVDLVRPLSVQQAIATLTHLNKAAATPALKAIKQAVANAVNNKNLPKDSLSIHTIEVNQGPTYKRFRPVSRGRAHKILKRTCHIKVVLESKIIAPAKKTSKKPNSKVKSTPAKK